MLDLPPRTEGPPLPAPHLPQARPLSRAAALALLLPAAILPSRGGPSPAADVPDAEAALAAAVSSERAARRVRDLVALGPRMGGTASGAAARDRRLAWFEEAGLEGWLEQDGEAWAHEEHAWSVVATSGETERALASAWPWGFSPAAEGEATLGPPDGEGGAWLCDRRVPRRAEGTPAVALVGGLATPDGKYARVRHLTAGDTNPYPVFGLGDADRDWLAGELEAGATVTVRFALDATIERAEVETVFARVPAREGAPPGYLLYCAHGDSDAGGPGANDNASGEAIVLEIAQAWATALAGGAAEPPPRELRFAIWGSEIHSSRAHLRRAEAAGAAPLLGVVNYDQAGFGAGADRLFVEPDDLPSNRDLIGSAVEVLRARGGTEGFPEKWATVRSLGGTDSYVFSSSRLFRDGGRPSITLYASAWGESSVEPRTPGMPGESWTDRDVVEVDHDPWYHSAGDLPENTTDREPWLMAWGARVGLLAGLRWLDELEALGESAAPAATHDER